MTTKPAPLCQRMSPTSPAKQPRYRSRIAKSSAGSLSFSRCVLRRPVMADYASSIRRAALEAGRLHRDLGIQSRVVHGSGRIDVYDILLAWTSNCSSPSSTVSLGYICASQRPACSSLPSAPRTSSALPPHTSSGIIILATTQASMTKASFGARHFRRARIDPQEVEAEAFAALFLLPRWLLDWHCDRAGLDRRRPAGPDKVYQLALRVGTSFKATVWTPSPLQRVRPRPPARWQASSRKRSNKRSCASYRPETYHSGRVAPDRSRREYADRGRPWGSRRRSPP